MRAQNYTIVVVFLLITFCLQIHTFGQGIQQEVVYSSTYGNGQSFGYLEYLPVGYDTSAEDFPVLISLHGLGWRAEGNGIEFSKLRKGNHVAKLIEAGQHFPVIVISPQQPKNVDGRYTGRGSWDVNIIDEVLERVKNLRRVDDNRIYITGTSMGGGGVWNYLKFHGDKIAAAAPICGTKTIGSSDAGSPKVKNTPIWAFHNFGDNVVNVSSTEQITDWINVNDPGVKAKKTVYAWSGHNSWDITYSGEGRDTTSNSSNQTEYGVKTNKPDIFSWLFTHNLNAPYPIKAYVTDENPDQLVIEFSQVVNQATGQGFQFNDPDIQVTAVTSGLGSSSLVFSLSKALSVGQIVNFSYDAQQGGIAGENGNFTTTFNEFEVLNKVGFMQLDSQDIAIDFGNGSKTPPPGWNQINNLSQGLVLNNAKRLDGTASTVAIRTLTSWPGAFADGVATGDNSGVFPDDVIETFWTVGSDEELLEIEGLEANENYTIYFFASRASSKDVRVTDYTIQSTTVSLDAGMNTNQTVKIANVTPDGNGKILISMRKPASSQFGYVGAMVIRKANKDTLEPTNQIPVVSVCPDTTVKLPANDVQLIGDATDQDGSITQKGWTQKSGPNLAQLSQNDSGQVLVSKVTEGEYVLEFSATDDQGATNSDEVLLVVQGNNTAPTVDAGPDVTITLPSDSVQLGGSAFDTDGTIVSYEWSLQSGSNTVSISESNNPQTWVNNFTAGTFLFNLTVTDNEGAAAQDVIQVQVVENQAPIIQTDDTVTLQLPVNSTTLVANVEDTDGEVSTIQWNQLSGPSDAQLTGTDAVELGINDLVEGTYVFEIMVTDNGGATSADRVVLKVLAEEVIDSTSSDTTQYYAGLQYQYYEGNWDMLPYFTVLKALKEGEIANFSLSPRTQDGYFAMRFTGYVDITTAGTYTFFTASDDGSKLYINGEEIVNNDGTHGKQERSGQVNLTAGKHAIEVTYFEKWGGETLEVMYEGPGISKQFIPSEVLYYTVEANNSRSENTGLRFQYYEGDWNMLPNFTGLQAVKEGDIENFTLSPREQDSYFAMRFTGYVDITTAGTYTFFTASDDGSKLYINGEEIVNNDGTHGKQERSGQVNLTAGKHAIEVTYFEKWGGETLEVMYEGPGISKQFIPSEVLSRTNGQNQRTLVNTDLTQPDTNLQHSLFQDVVNIKTYPNPVVDELHIALAEKRNVHISLIDKLGNVIYTTKSLDQQQLAIDLSGLNVAKGMFILRIIDLESRQLILSRNMLHTGF